ncbi:MAG TPA: LiaF domain-containing protein [Anaerolineales bacterium]|nr:LiaF domain-containing protein [Anaerolineales bacterium]
MDSHHDRGGLVGPILLIGLGLVFLLTNLGMLSTSIWGVLLRIWPVILIAIGVDLLIGRRSLWGRLLALVLILAVLAGGLWIGGVRIGQVQRGQVLQSETVSQPLGKATHGVVSVDPAIGVLDIGALAAGSSNLAEGHIALPRGAKVTQQASVSGDTATLNLRMNGSWYGPTINVDESMKWTLDLNRDVPLDLRFNVIAGQGLLDLSQLTVEALDVTSVFGQTKLTLPATGSFKAHASGVFGQTIVTVPADLGVKAKVSAVFGTASVPPDYRKQGDWYYSPNYDTATHKVELTAEEVFGQVIVR